MRFAAGRQGKCVYNINHLKTMKATAHPHPTPPAHLINRSFWLQILEWNNVSLIDRSFEEVCSIMDRFTDVVELLVEHATDFRMCDLLDENNFATGSNIKYNARKSGSDAVSLGLIPGKEYAARGGPSSSSSSHTQNHTPHISLSFHHFQTRQRTLLKNHRRRPPGENFQRHRYKSARPRIWILILRFIFSLG